MKAVEKRQKPRVGLRARANFRIVGPAGLEPPISLHVRDISKTGIGLMHHARIEPETRLVLSFGDGQSNAKGLKDITYKVAQCRSVGDGCYAIGARICTEAEQIDDSVSDLAQRLASLK